MRWLACLILLVTGTARADDGDLNAFFGIALGPPVEVGGDLGARMAGAGLAVEPRVGLRIRRLGVELTMLGSGLVDRTKALDAPVLLLVSPRVGFYPVAGRTFQLLVHAGIGIGSVSSSSTQIVPCRPTEDCITKSIDGVRYPGHAAEVGITAQVHLGHGEQHPMLWLDLGWSASENQIATVATTGQLLLVTLGIADALE